MDPVKYRYCNYSEAMGGAKEARKGMYKYLREALEECDRPLPNGFIWQRAESEDDMG